MYTGKPKVENSLFTFFPNMCFNFFPDLFYYLFNSCGMDPSVCYEPFERKSCNFTPYRIKSGEGYNFWCIVNNQVNTCCCFEGPYIPSLSADYSPFHFIIGEGHCSYGRIGDI